MILRQKLGHPVNGYWDGGKKDTFDWEAEGPSKSDDKGYFVKIESWIANHWFYVALSKTEKLTLRNAMFHLRAVTKVPSSFEYIEE